MRKIDLQQEVEHIVDFIRQQLKQAGMDKLVIGLSGGIDSSLAAALSVMAVGRENVTGIMLPYRGSHPDSYNHAKEVADQLGIDSFVIEITPMVDAYFNTYEPDAPPLRRGNRMARERMCVLYDQSAKLNALVVGTGNKTELLIGYVTQHGDGACAFEPIGHIYKTEVWEMAKSLGLPKSVIEKKPTADLWDGQTDEGELGITYATLDKILYHLIELEWTAEEIADSGYQMNDIEKTIRLVKRSAFKRQMPPSPKLS